MNEGGNNTGRFLCSCVACHNRRNQSPALRQSSVPTEPRRDSYHMNTFTSPAAGSPNHVYNEIPSRTFQSQMSSYLPPAYVTPIFRNTHGQVYNGTHSRPSPARGPMQIRSYTPPSSRTWASQDTFEDLHSQTTPDTVALPDPNNWIYRINNIISSEIRILTSATQRINNTMPLNDLPVIRQTLDVISSVSTFPTQPSSTPSSNLLSSNNPPYLMSNTAPNTPQLSLLPNNPPYLMSSTAPNTSQLSLSPNNPPYLPNNPPYLMSSAAPNTSQLSLSPNNPPYVMSSAAPNTPQLSLHIPSATVQESSIDSSNQDFEVTEIAYVQRDSGVNSFSAPNTPQLSLSPNNPPYLMSSTAPNTPQLSLSPNNPTSLMSSTAPSTPQLSLNIPSATVQESSIDSSDQYTLEFNNNANEPMANAMDYTE
uniref:Uncharacterized protein n=1 Tax=Biomphalaria glabrata TaxID=6526 RepID=A0A2C9LH29_BIOGL